MAVHDKTRLIGRLPSMKSLFRKEKTVSVVIIRQAVHVQGKRLIFCDLSLWRCYNLARI